MSMRELVTKCRTYRRFQQNAPVSLDTLRGLVDLARLSPSGGNMQPLKFMLSADPGRNAAIFPHLAWAAYLKPWPGPAEGERPAAYVIILCDKEISPNPGCNHGIAAQSIVLGAAEQGLGSCMIGSIERDALRAALEIPARYDIVLIIALGRPAETVRLEPLGPDGSIRYWRDDRGVHHVPKRSLDELIIS